MEISKSKKILIISGLSILCLGLIGGAVAYFSNVLFADLTVDTSIKGLDYYINYAKGTDITSGTINPSSTYEGGNSVTVTLYKKDNTYDIYGHIYLDVTSISDELSYSEVLKYAVISNDGSVLSSGDLNGITSGTSKLLAYNIPLSTSSTTYTIYLWFDEMGINDYSLEGETIKANIRCYATMKELTVKSLTAAEYITSLYTDATKSTVTNNSITYNTAPSVSLMNDRLGGTTSSLDGGNIRYYGASPNNYIYFNCSDYSSQTSDTCEKWRIIGVFNGKLKIMRNSSIGNYSWDTSANTVNEGWGINEWSQADLMKLLNPGYTSETVGGSLYYNSGSGNCYAGWENGTTSCNFTTTGIKNDATRNKIATVTWNTGGWNDEEVYSNVIYGKERGTTTVVPGTCSGIDCNDSVIRQTTWSGKIALAYPSDYGYATDFSQCSQNLHDYYTGSTDSNACRSNDWMYPILGTSYYSWLLTPELDDATAVWGVMSTGFVDLGFPTMDTSSVVPTLFLDADEVIKSGSGTSQRPYKLR